MPDAAKLGLLRRHSRNLKLHLLLAENWVPGCKPRCAGLLFGANPDGAGAANHGKRIVTDDFRRAFELKFDGIVGEGADGAILIGNADDHASGIGTIGLEPCVVRQQGKLLVYALSREGFGNDLLSLEVALDAQVSPMTYGFSEIGDKRREAKMGKFSFVWIGFGHQLVRDKKLQMIAIGTYVGFGEADGFIAARPVEGGLENDLIGRIAL